MKILIVDDSLMDRKLLMAVLKKNGVDPDVILQAADGEEGLKILSQNHRQVKLIFLDWQMPVMDGIGFMKAVVNVPEVARIPIVMITASGSVDNQNFARTVNPNLADYIIKPYQPDQIRSVLRTHFPPS